MIFIDANGSANLSGKTSPPMEHSNAGNEAPETAVLLLVFNRPETTAQVFAAIRQVKPKRLYIAADGQRELHPEDQEKVALVRKIIDNIDWPCSVRKKLRKENAGCKYGVSDAINWFFENEEEGIILEDDTLPDPRFFRYAEKALNHARDNENIGAVCGYNILGANPRGKPFLSVYPHIWGWATWRRVWREYQVDIEIEEKEMKRIIEDHTKNRKVAETLGKIGTLNQQGRFNSWDFQLAFLLCRRKMLSIFPPVNLIHNIGFGTDATHTVNGVSAPLYHHYECSFNFDELKLDPEFDRKRFNIDFPSRLTVLKRMIISRFLKFTESIINLTKKQRGILS